MTTAYTTNKKGHSCDPVSFQNHTSNSSNLPTFEDASKALATIKAMFALHGHGVHDGDSQDFIVVQKNWGHSRHCRDYAALVAFGRQLGVL